jgi:hypothetical protein
MKGESPQQNWDRLQRQYQRAVKDSYPNPKRQGCPGTDALQELASRSARHEDIEEDEQWRHVIHCAPCYQEYLDSRESCRLGEGARVRRESR